MSGAAALRAGQDTDVVKTAAPVAIPAFVRGDFELSSRIG